MAGAPGLEPGTSVPKTDVLPLHHAPIRISSRTHRRRGATGSSIVVLALLSESRLPSRRWAGGEVRDRTGLYYRFRNQTGSPHMAW